MLYDFETYYLHFAENPIQFGSVVTSNGFVKVGHKSLSSKFYRRQTHMSHYTINAEFRTPFEWFYIDDSMYVQNVDGRDLWHSLH